MPWSTPTGYWPGNVPTGEYAHRVLRAAGTTRCDACARPLDLIAGWTWACSGRLLPSRTRDGGLAPVCSAAYVIPPEPRTTDG